MGKSSCCDKTGLKKGPWTPEEDQKLLTYIQEHGHGSWRALPPKADIKRGEFSLEEEQTIIQLHALLGNRWSTIAKHLSKRTDNEIKNYWNTHLKKRFTKMGIDPMTHKPKNHALGSGQPKDIANLSHMAQWESARLEAEARIVRESKSKLVSNPYHTTQLLSKATIMTQPPLPSLPPPWPPCLDILKVWQGAWTNPRKDINTPIVKGFFASNRTLESPTSILNPLENMLTIPTVGSINQDSFVTGINYIGNPNACTFGRTSNNNYQDEVNGIMDNSMQIHDVTDPILSSTYLVDSLKFPSFMEDFTDLPPGIEENKVDYWSNVLNIASSPIDYPVF
ncbi:hypothetical protein BUALT_Bualt17G0073000 [Buddleja alternifolia]|uniref:Uncharacterized protein n=1 Tax=Buddleja alternifolia TaxID=168488 RepID=A0AAV6W6R0_9LAMI|nr:hypothetical protein BUALT_Bualt17G0073000 [Buddleja alternifolia]